MKGEFFPPGSFLEQYINQFQSNPIVYRAKLRSFEQYNALTIDSAQEEWRFAQQSEINWDMLFTAPKSEPYYRDYGNTITIEDHQLAHSLINHEYSAEHQTKLSALLFCLSQQTIIIRIPVGVGALDAIYLSSQKFAACSALIIIVEKNASVTIVDMIDHAMIALRTITIYVGQNARCTIIHEQQKSTIDRVTYTHTVLYADKDSFVENVYFAAESGIMRSWVYTVLQGEGASVNIHGLCAAFDNGQITCITRQKHDAESTKSGVHIQGLVANQAQMIYAGTIFIAQGSIYSDAKQLNKTIVLSEYARAVSIPRLEVLANTVSCKHGSATDYLLPEQILFLQSRGIEERKSRLLLLEAFLHQGLDNASAYVQERGFAYCQKILQELLS
jgi:Fe-S cluster assembly scaffold protein SufB